VSRFIDSGFPRLKFGKDLEKRRLSSRVFEARGAAHLNLGPDGDT
jgi:hypothetical protein